MQRLAFKMKLNPGQKEAYTKRHNELWPELKKLLKDAGVSEYSIFIDEETNTLFAFQKVLLFFPYFSGTFKIRCGMGLIEVHIGVLTHHG